MLNRVLIGVVGATVIGVPGVAAADPPPAPDINAFPSARPSDYAVMDSAWYAFGVLDGVICVLDKQSGGYGCSGPLPGGAGRCEFGQRWRVGEARIRERRQAAVRHG